MEKLIEEFQLIGHSFDFFIHTQPENIIETHIDDIIKYAIQNNHRNIFHQGMTYEKIFYKYFMKNYKKILELLPNKAYNIYIIMHNYLTNLTIRNDEVIDKCIIYILKKHIKEILIELINNKACEIFIDSTTEYFKFIKEYLTKNYLEIIHKTDYNQHLLVFLNQLKNYDGIAYYIDHDLTYTKYFHYNYNKNAMTLIVNKIIDPYKKLYTICSWITERNTIEYNDMINDLIFEYYDFIINSGLLTYKTNRYLNKPLCDVLHKNYDINNSKMHEFLISHCYIMISNTKYFIAKGYNFIAYKDIYLNLILNDRCVSTSIHLLKILLENGAIPESNERKKTKSDYTKVLQLLEEYNIKSI
jgi:hypothetical protein